MAVIWQAHSDHRAEGNKKDDDGGEDTYSFLEPPCS